MANQRIIRINEEIRRELAELVRSEIKDPRVSGTMISVVDVETTSDLKIAKVFVSILDETKKEEALAGLNGASGYLRKEIARRINLRNTPQLVFKIDESIAYGIKMSEMINSVMKDSDK